MDRKPLSLKGAMLVREGIARAARDRNLSILEPMPDTDEAREAFSYGSRIAQVTVWNYELFLAATRGSEAFTSTTPDAGFFDGPQYQLWLPDYSPAWMAPSVENQGLIWTAFATLFTRQRLPSLEEMLYELSEFEAGHLTKQQRDEFVSSAGKRIVIVTDVLALENDERRKHPNNPQFCFSGSHWVIEGENVPELLCDWVAAWKFMTGSLASVEPMRANHDDRKSFKKSNLDLNDFRGVILRHTERKQSQDSKNVNVDWSCQWLVNGHWRRLHEPRKSDGATVTYVQPHVKGPEDMPFRAPRETVYVAKR